MKSCELELKAFFFRPGGWAGRHHEKWSHQADVSEKANDQKTALPPVHAEGGSASPNSL